MYNKRIKQLRQEKGWTQRELAIRLGMTYPAISRIESGSTNIQFSRLEQIAVLFDVTLVYLLGADEEIQSLDSRELEAVYKRLHAVELEKRRLERTLALLIVELKEGMQVSP